MKCPVCKTEQTTQVCENCGFSELDIEFLNKDDAQRWENSVLKQCCNIYQTLSNKNNYFENCQLAAFDYPRRGCNVKVVEPKVPDEFYGNIVYADKRQIHIRIPGKMKAIKFAFKWCINEKEIEDIASDGYYVIDKEQIFYIVDEVYKAEVDWKENLSKSLKNRNSEKEPYRGSYDAFVKKHINSMSWNFTEDVIYYNEAHQKPNTYFCAYDNPPFEIVNTQINKNDTHYTIKVMLRNLSKERRNQPLKFRYRIGTPTINNVHDWTDTITPAPQYTTAVITFDYDGKDKPYFEIIN